ncbi:MAG: forkhead-associated protein [Pseudoalteromonas sp.]|uniref:FHA domain-containing protein n=1 Tax=Pseudoalteromonas phenolica TaxID=161398 RepID=UPI000C091CAE|nr:forkhead-associated protein [Pseudoalteromonas sp.]
MAYLIDEQKLEKVYLKSYHTIGRFKYNVDTLINSPEISRHHAIIEFTQGHWLIRDVSTNGIWINDKKISKNLPYQLCLNDKVDFAAPGRSSFVVGDLSTDCQFLVSQSDSGKVIEIKDQLLLPNEQEASHIAYFDSMLNYWFLEDLFTNDRQVLIDGGLISIFNDQWQFYCSSPSTITKQLKNEVAQNVDYALSFNVSLDEENTHLTLNVADQTVDLGTRSHHYLLLLLARTRILDKEAGLENELQGWMYREELAKALGVQMNHMNIMVHRARKQLADACLDICPEFAYMLESENGKVRLNCNDITIVKGSKLETRISI